MLVDFHSHSALSDGTLSVEEMVAAAERRGYQAYAVTDHARNGDPAYCDVVEAVAEGNDALLEEFFDQGTLPIDHITCVTVLDPYFYR